MIEHLRPGETIRETVEMPGKNSRFHMIEHPDGTVGQSVLLEMDQGGYVSPVRIVEPGAEFTVSTMEGNGTLFVQPGDHPGVTRRVRLRGTREYVLASDDVYGYVSKGPWIVRDDSNIPFELEFEKPVSDTTPSLEGGRVLRSIKRASARRQQN